MDLDSRKKSRRDSMMRSNSLDTKEMREIGCKEARDSRGFPIFWMVIMEDVFPTEGKNSEAPFRNKIWRERREKGYVRGGATAIGAMRKSKYIWVIEEKRPKEITQTNTSCPPGSEVPFEP